MKLSKEENKALCERFPFLIPSNRWSGRRITEGAGFWPGDPDRIPEYDWEYTELDEMPDGWRIAFGEALCEELKAVLDAVGHTDEYRIVQIKEKYGYLRWYDNANTREGYKIISKYARISQRTCIVCGKPATQISTGWISPYCDECVSKIKHMERFVPIEEWYDNDPDDGGDDEKEGEEG